MLDLCIQVCTVARSHSCSEKKYAYASRPSCSSMEDISETKVITGNFDNIAQHSTDI